jgi:hypothetical protein
MFGASLPSLATLRLKSLSDVIPDPRRSYEALTVDDLARLGRLGALEVDEFFARNRRLTAWRGKLRFTALVQGGAEHYLRCQRGIWDLDIAVFFAQHPDLPDRPYLRRGTRQWDWGPSKFGRCPLDHPDYQGRAVDVMLWVIPDSSEPLNGLMSWLDDRRTKKPDPQRTPDLAHEPVVLIDPDIGRVVWDPPNVPPPRHKTEGHTKRPAGHAPA